jgi:outer membrane biosynthesis protein TonB
MSLWSLALSLIVHGSCIGVFFLHNTFSPKSKNVVLEEMPPCTIPLEVTAVSDLSCAPISRPKVESALASDDPEKQVVEYLLPESQPLKKPEPEPIPDPIVEPEPIPDPIVEPKPAEKPAPKPEPILDLIPEPEPLPKPRPVKNRFTAPKKRKEKSKKDKPKKGKKNKAPESKTEVDPIFLILDRHEKDVKKKKPKPADFISVLKDVDKSRNRGPTAETPITNPDSDSDYGAASIGPKMSMSVQDRVARLLESAWHPPLRANEDGGLIVFVHMDMNPDGTVRNAQLDHQRGTPNHPAYRAGCDSVLRAIYEFQFKPLPFPPELYHQWKTFDFQFNPK